MDSTIRASDVARALNLFDSLEKEKIGIVDDISLSAIKFCPCYETHAEEDERILELHFFSTKDDEGGIEKGDIHIFIRGEKTEFWYADCSYSDRWEDYEYIRGGWVKGSRIAKLDEQL